MLSAVLDQYLQNDEILAKSIETQKMKNNGVLAWNTEKALNIRINKYGTINRD